MTVTERGRAIATITAVSPPADLKWARALVIGGRAQWAGKAAVRFSCFDARLARVTRTALRTLQPAGR